MARKACIAVTAYILKTRERIDLKLCKISQTSSYIVFGLLTTLVNFLVYLFFTKTIPLDYKIAASLAWILAVLFAFITNKFYVFQSRKTDIALLCREFSSFLFFRTLSYFADILSMIIMVEALLIPDTAAKLAASGLVAILNYFASKHVVFRLGNR